MKQLLNSFVGSFTIAIVLAAVVAVLFTAAKRLAFGCGL